MIFVPVRGTLSNGSITVELNKPLNACMIGLLDYSMPSINDKRALQNSIDITCDQIDSTFWNPKRLLKRLCFNRVIKFDYYNLWTANIIEFHQVDSSDKFLTLNIARTFGLGADNSDFGINFEDKKIHDEDDDDVLLTIAVKPITNESSRWTCI